MKLVKNKLSTFDWTLRDYMLRNAVGEENGITQIDLAYVMSVHFKEQISTSMIRASFKKLKTQSDTIFGIVGRLHFIPRSYTEKAKAMEFEVKTLVSRIETVLSQAPELAPFLHAMVGHYQKKANKAVQGQLQAKFNGWERDTVDYYAKRYEVEVE